MAQNGRGFLVFLIAILKGGARKTTSTMFLAFALAKMGYEVLVIDADTGTQGVTDWSSDVYAEGGELPFHVYQWSHSQGLLVPFVQQRQKETGATIVLIDVGGEAPEVVKQAVAIADLMLSPVNAEQGEINRLKPTRALVAGKVKRHRLVLTRVPSVGVGRAKAAREAFVADGYEVLDTEVPRHVERYADVWGSVPDDLGAYEPMAVEMLKVVS